MPNDPKEGEIPLGIWCDLLEKELKTALDDLAKIRKAKSPSEKSVFKAYFASGPENRERVLNCEPRMLWLSNPCRPNRVFLSRASQLPMLLW